LIVFLVRLDRRIELIGHRARSAEMAAENDAVRAVPSRPQCQDRRGDGACHM